jgi:hypothetical protein
VTSISSQEFINLFACVGHILVLSIDGIDDQNDLDRRLVAADGPEGVDGLRCFVIDQRKVLLRKTGGPDFAVTTTSR